MSETDYQQRVIDEKAQLDEKLGKLQDFLYGEKSKALEEIDRDLLKRQMEFMSLYSATLQSRILRFNRVR